jgi:gamma-glutamyltranspeptidase / glutathione hydrolase
MRASWLPLGAACALLLAGCSFGLGEASEPSAKGFVVGDEPYAVRAGASVLAEGGSAADAVTAMYFTLSVTYPVAAGLGGGGLCIVHDTENGRTEDIEFLARDASGGGAYAVPGNVRGFAVIQGAYGRLPWQRDVVNAEQLASAGFPISSALAMRIAAAQDVVRLDAGLAAEFLDESGKAKAGGARAVNADLGQTLSAIRTQGAAGFYRGAVAGKIAVYSSAQGGALTTAELDSYTAARTLSLPVSMGALSTYLPREQVGAGAFASAMLSDIQGNSPDLLANNSAHTIALATARALDRFKIASLPQDLGATGFAAIDSNGQAVACAVTMNGPFGSGRTAEGTGVALARAPSVGQTGLASAFLAPVIAMSGDSVVLAGAGAGGPNGTASILYTLVRLSAGQVLGSSQDLRTTGAAPYETVNVIACQSGTCAALADPGAQGLGVAASK